MTADQGIDRAFGHILDAITDGVYVTGPDRSIVYWSAGAERITGYSADEAVGHRCDEDLLGHTDLDGVNICLAGCPLQDCLDTGTEHALSEVFLRRKDGERLAVYVKTALFEFDGERYGVEIFGELETVAGKELASKVQQLSTSSISDPLTGLFNRRYLDAALAQHFAMYTRLGRKYGVIEIDIDDVKAVNDQLGHLTGDGAITFVAGILSDNVREMDVVARYGGDEFVVICALATDQDLATYGRRLVRLVHDSRFTPAEEAGLRITVSGGGALVAFSDEDETEAFARADSAMYEAKNSGRDDFAVAASGERG